MAEIRRLPDPRPAPSARRSSRFTKRDVRRAVEAVKEAGLEIASIRIERDGMIHIVLGTPTPVASPNLWDSAAS